MVHHVEMYTTLSIKVFKYQGHVKWGGGRNGGRTGRERDIERVVVVVVGGRGDMCLSEGESGVAGRGSIFMDVYDSIIISYKFAKIMSQEYLFQTKTLNPLSVLWLWH